MLPNAFQQNARHSSVNKILWEYEKQNTVATRPLINRPLINGWASLQS